ncbi:MAG: hypothetical protein GYA36_19000 [Veillonellaceae bacterium]|nr:hypothetical protein [Veillonellaceae bacterium]
MGKQEAVLVFLVLSLCCHPGGPRPMDGGQTRQLVAPTVGGVCDTDESWWESTYDRPATDDEVRRCHGSDTIHVRETYCCAVGTHDCELRTQSSECGARRLRTPAPQEGTTGCPN